MTELPIELSADGKRNAFVHHCAILNQRRSYAVCLHLCGERKKGRLDVTYSDCSTQIGKKLCPALKMRKQEVEAGHALFFEERKVVTPGVFDKAKELVSSAVSIVSGKKADAPQKPKSAIDGFGQGSYAQAITNAVAAEPKKKEEPKAAAEAPPKIEQRSGESLLEMARRLMSEKSQ